MLSLAQSFFRFISSPPSSLVFLLYSSPTYPFLPLISSSCLSSFILSFVFPSLHYLFRPLPHLLFTSSPSSHLFFLLYTSLTYPFASFNFLLLSLILHVLLCLSYSPLPLSSLTPPFFLFSCSSPPHPPLSAPPRNPCSFSSP